MEDEIVSFETAMLLKEKGFNEPCSYFYEDNELCELLCAKPVPSP